MFISLEIQIYSKFIFSCSLLPHDHDQHFAERSIAFYLLNIVTGDFKKMFVV